MWREKHTKPKALEARRLSKRAPKHIRLGIWLHQRRAVVRIVCFSFAVIIGFSTFSQFVTQVLVDKNYLLSAEAQSVLGATSAPYGMFLKFNAETNTYDYNTDYLPGQDTAGNDGRPKFSANFSNTPKDGVRVDDPVHKTSVTFKPKFPLASPKQDGDRLLYPIKGQNAVKVITLQASGFKEDIILNSYLRDTLSYTYMLDAAPGTEARMESDGSVGIYGATPALLGNVTAGTEQDEQLLQKARESAPKDTLLYRIPAPFIKEYNTKKVQGHAWFSLEGNELTIHASNLKAAAYPLSIDPSVYVESAAQFMRGNNETNIDFDVTNELIQKGSTTGARFDSFDPSLALPSARWGHGTAVAGGYVYAVGGANGGTNQSTVYWAQFDTVNKDIDSPNPGNGTCANWCTDSAYNLPAARTSLSLVAYNGFLYAIGGRDSSCSGALNICNTVYIAKLGANGEPSLWHPTGGTPVYWYQASNLSTELAYSAAVAYNNRLYLIGGQTNSASGGISTVSYTNINPTGDIGSWSSTTSLPSVRFGHSAQIYNDRLYLIGGNSGGASLQNSIHYIKIQNNGTLTSSWTSTNSFSTARQSWGGNFSTIWGGYLYVTGGCAAIDAQGECTSAGITNGGSVELASINADGSISNWGSITNITNARIGYGLVGWRNTLYTVGGCTNQNVTTGACTTTSTDARYGTINQDGDASTVATSVSNTNPPCNSGTPSNCDLPTTTSIGHMLTSTVITNGYLYIIGGCTNVGCTTISGNTIYSAINSDGSLSRPATCPGGSFVDSYCVDSTDPVSGGVVAAGTAVFNNTIYVVGGQSSSGLKGSVYSVGVNSDGSLNGAWTAQTFTNLAATSVSYTFAYARANPSSASTYPGNLFIFGGCSASSGGIGCTSGSNTQAVYKCNILPNGLLEEANTDDCDTANQLQIGTVPGSSGTGLALHAGTVYANYIYLIGGVSPGQTDLKTVRYAQFDNNNNVVAVSGSAWIQSPSEMSVGRRRGTSFGYNGYLYAVGGYDASQGGVLSDIQFAKIDVSNGSLGAFTESGVTINQRWGLSVPVSSSYAFVIGGCTNGASPTCNANSMTRVVQTFQIYNNDSGSPAGYNTASNLFNTDRFGASSAVHNGYLYVAGGCVSSSSDCGDATNSVQYAPLNDDGTVGSWSATSANLPADVAWGELEVAGGTLYYIGGQNDGGTAQSTVYYGTPSSGNITSWGTASNGLPAARTQHSAAVWNNRIYVTGGNNSGGTAQTTVYISPQLNAGGNITSSWNASGTAFNVARNGHTTIAYANNLYVLGGYTGSAYLSDVQFTQINADGTVDPWSYTTSLPTPIRQGDGFAANGYMYLIGGRSSDEGCVNKTLVAPISANTTIASGNNPTGVGEWYETNTRYNTNRYGVSAAYSEGRVYLNGGVCTVRNFPSVLSVTPSTFGTNTTAHNVDMPASVNSDDLLLALFTSDGNPTVTVSGWTQIGTTVANGSNLNTSIWAKKATGSEGGTQVNFVTSATEQAAAQVYRIAAGTWFDSGTITNDVNASGGSSASTTTPNPPSLDPSGWGTEKTLWIAYAGGSRYASVTSYPSSYTDGAHAVGGTDTNGASTSSARLEAETASQDPGTFTMSGTAQQSVARTIAVRPAGPALAYTDSQRVVHSTLLSQPQVAKYSRMIDVDSDVFPTYWLLNGIDNSIGARWMLNYRSMTNTTTSCTSPAMTTWGQDTNVGAVTLGTPGTYTPRDGAGNNTNCARFFYLTVSIDSSQSFGYPEDVTRGPTITDLSLFFTADPSKRLRHGKTFTGGELQPLDTPF